MQLMSTSFHTSRHIPRLSLFSTENPRTLTEKNPEEKPYNWKKTMMWTQIPLMSYPQSRKNKKQRTNEHPSYFSSNEPINHIPQEEIFTDKWLFGSVKGESCSLTRLSRGFNQFDWWLDYEALFFSASKVSNKRGRPLKRKNMKHQHCFFFSKTIVRIEQMQNHLRRLQCRNRMKQLNYSREKNSCNIFHSGCNMTTTITGGTHSTLWVTFLRPGLAAGYALMPMQ